MSAYFSDTLSFDFLEKKRYSINSFVAQMPSSARGIKMARKRAHVFISGWVQGVFFRADTKDLARKMGVTGWVRNLWDGRVEAVFEGEEEAVEHMIAWCHRGPPGAKVEEVEVIYEDYTGEYETFSIRYVIS
jgi:acylphosphatase